MTAIDVLDNLNRDELDFIFGKLGYNKSGGMTSRFKKAFNECKRNHPRATYRFMCKYKMISDTDHGQSAIALRWVSVFIYAQKRNFVIETLSSNRKGLLIDGKVICTGNILDIFPITKAERILELETELVKKDQDLVKKDQELVKKNQQLVKKDQELVKKNQQLVKKDQELVKKDQELAKKDQELSETKNELVETQKELGETKQVLAETQKELGETKQVLIETKKILAETKKILAETQKEFDVMRSLFVFIFFIFVLFLLKLV